jgi:hypothetical protein
MKKRAIKRLSDTIYAMPVDSKYHELERDICAGVFAVYSDMLGALMRPRESLQLLHNMLEEHGKPSCGELEFGEKLDQVYETASIMFALTANLLPDVTGQDYLTVRDHARTKR